ncbi:MAG: 16S rRNA (cytosine(1402)-N(4))-methyltransferase [Bacteroidetes bacterium RIFOXYA12_FULL_35_11]|nr:MAG: 16S rRNA (cytosine(1402)-N(4))-methyltransferase [Bacteroidetes bacterium GWF2_35_48]OFY72462.1 MAG: 16S rRNA (cytosine(1402)-N(4))-methyltransferase [Bacteroidetes bacterium RIFOXYA12_FULL_35_11]HBX50496.1 16S rRNA (cytosine(1402)-N(4))-methyltransferase [Bacteroidales bacterium]
MSIYHTPVLLKESIEGLNIKPDGVYVDATFGGGGHSQEILKKLSIKGKILVFDQDPDAKINQLHDNRVIYAQANFRFLKNFLRYHDIEEIDGLLADLGVSSHHFDSEKRGFSYRFDSTLDMRMNPNQRVTAEVLLNTYSEAQLKNLFEKYGEINNAKTIASVIVAERQKTKIDSVVTLKSTLSAYIPKQTENKYLSKLFQALRIEVNAEIDSLKTLLLSASDVLSEEGRIAVITYHSIEDRLVKNFFKNGKFEGEAEKDIYGKTSLLLIPVNRKVIIPTDEEIERNPRARSAKLRIAQKA